MTAASPLAAAMTERQLDEGIRSIADGLGLLRYHTFNSRKSPSGFPDLVLVGPRGVLFRELKRQSEKPTPAQEDWLRALREAGQDADVWRPADLLSKRVARELTAIAGIKVAATNGDRQ
jgi:hypothetical protein